MNYKKFLGAASTALIIAIAISTFAPRAAAQATYKTLYSFAGGKTDGANPQAGLIFDGAGNLYGTTYNGGPHYSCVNTVSRPSSPLVNKQGCGTVFKLTPNPDGSWTESVLHIFKSDKNGAEPSASLIFDAAGNLYGTTSGGGDYGPYECAPLGCGVVFQFTPNLDGTWKEKVLHTFTDGKDGGTGDGFEALLAPLIFDQAGNLYGTTPSGGTTGCWVYQTCGVVFELTPQANGRWKEKVLHTFHGKDGGMPYAGLIFDGAGNLYSTTSLGGLGYGVVFELIPNPNGSWKEKVLRRFGEYTGGTPLAGLIFDQVENLYGTTSSGPYGVANAFELTPKADGGWKEKVLHQFTSGPYGPYAGLIFDAAGNLYGTTSGGGAYGAGMVFKLTPNADGSWTESSLHDFCSLAACADGAGPVAGLIFDSAGNLYGTASSGGATGHGVVFELTP